MSDKDALLYIDDNENIVRTFDDAVRKQWNLRMEVLSNETFGQILEENYDKFESEICSIIAKDEHRIKCVFLDLDFSGGQVTEKIDQTGINLGVCIRKKWPLLPIIISTRFTNKELIKKGLVLDFDNICSSTDLIEMTVEEFNGMLLMAKDKRIGTIKNIGDTPISFTLGENRYLRRSDEANVDGDFVFIAMPFDKEIVSDNVWYSIKTAIESVGLIPVRVDADNASTPILEKIATYIFDSNIFIAVLTGWNANVLYELGLAHTTNKDSILLAEEAEQLKLPFDVQHMKVITYSEDKMEEINNKLCSRLEEIKQLNK